MQKLEPTWQNLPTHFKKNLVEYLDFESRLHLAATSKTDFDLVESCPLKMHHIFLELYSPEPDNNAYPEYFYMLQEKKNSKKKIYAVFGSAEDGVKALLGILKHPKSRIDTFDIYFKSRRGERIEYYQATMEKFAQELALRIGKNEGKKIKTRSLSFSSGFKTTEVFLDILNCFDSSTLTQLRIQPRVSEEIVEKIISSEYWENLNSFTLQGKTTVSVEKLLPPKAIHLEINRYCRSLMPQNVLNLINTFINRNSPWASYFHVLTTPDHRYDMDGTMRELTRTSTLIERDEQYTDFHFKMSSNNLVFVARIFAAGVQGAVCHVESLEKDKEWLLRV